MWDAADRVLMPDEELTVTVRKAALVADALIRDAFAELAQVAGVGLWREVES
jgi:hypothetical protein